MAIFKRRRRKTPKSKALEEYPLFYEDMKFRIGQKATIKIKTRKGGKDNKMSKEVKTAKTRKSYNKSRGEHVKDIVIAMLVTAIIAFTLGIRYAQAQQAQVDNAISEVTATMTAEAVEAPVKK